MSRSTWKGPFSTVQLLKGKTKQEIKTWSRASMILPAHLGFQVKVYSGKAWVSVKILEEMIGHKFGEFVSTRKKAFHKFKKVNQQKSRK